MAEIDAIEVAITANADEMVDAIQKARQSLDNFARSARDRKVAIKIMAEPDEKSLDAAVAKVETQIKRIVGNDNLEIPVSPTFKFSGSALRTFKRDIRKQLWGNGTGNVEPITVPIQPGKVSAQGRKGIKDSIGTVTVDLNWRWVDKDVQAAIARSIGTIDVGLKWHWDGEPPTGGTAGGGPSSPPPSGSSGGGASAGRASASKPPKGHPSGPKAAPATSSSGASAGPAPRETFPCSECSQFFYSEANLADHRAKKHSPAKQRASGGSLTGTRKIGTTTTKAKAQSYNSATPRDEVSCPDCGRVFINSGAMATHRKTHAAKSAPVAPPSAGETATAPAPTSSGPRWRANEKRIALGVLRNTLGLSKEQAAAEIERDPNGIIGPLVKAVTGKARIPRRGTAAPPPGEAAGVRMSQSRIGAKYGEVEFGPRGMSDEEHSEGTRRAVQALGFVGVGGQFVAKGGSPLSPEAQAQSLGFLNSLTGYQGQTMRGDRRRREDSGLPYKVPKIKLSGRPVVGAEKGIGAASAMPNIGIERGMTGRTASMGRPNEMLTPEELGGHVTSFNANIDQRIKELIEGGGKDDTRAARAGEEFKALQEAMGKGDLSKLKPHVRMMGRVMSALQGGDVTTARRYMYGDESSDNPELQRGMLSLLKSQAPGPFDTVFRKGGSSKNAYMDIMAGAASGLRDQMGFLDAQGKLKGQAEDAKERGAVLRDDRASIRAMVNDYIGRLSLDPDDDLHINSITENDLGFIGREHGKTVDQVKAMLSREQRAAIGLPELPKRPRSPRGAPAPGTPMGAPRTTRFEELVNGLMTQGGFDRETAIRLADLSERRKEPEGRAKGGPIHAGTPYLVGEQGPEMIIPAKDGRVVSNNDLKALYARQFGEHVGAPAGHKNVATENSYEWKKLRGQVIHDQPYCAHCGIGRGEARLAGVKLTADKIVSQAEGGDPWDRSNLQTLCSSCNSRKAHKSGNPDEIWTHPRPAKALQHPKMAGFGSDDFLPGGKFFGVATIREALSRAKRRDGGGYADSRHIRRNQAHPVQQARQGVDMETGVVTDMDAFYSIKEDEIKAIERQINDYAPKARIGLVREHLMTQPDVVKGMLGAMQRIVGAFPETLLKLGSFGTDFTKFPSHPFKETELAVATGSPARTEIAYNPDWLRKSAALRDKEHRHQIDLGHWPKALRDMPSAEATTLHELGHTVDANNDWTLGMEQREAQQLADFADDAEFKAIFEGNSTKRAIPRVAKWTRPTSGDNRRFQRVPDRSRYLDDSSFTYGSLPDISNYAGRSEFETVAENFAAMIADPRSVHPRVTNRFRKVAEWEREYTEAWMREEARRNNNVLPSQFRNFVKNAQLDLGPEFDVVGDIPEDQQMARGGFIPGYSIGGGMKFTNMSPGVGGRLLELLQQSLPNAELVNLDKALDQNLAPLVAKAQYLARLYPETAASVLRVTSDPNDEINQTTSLARTRPVRGGSEIAFRRGLLEAKETNEYLNRRTEEGRFAAMRDTGGLFAHEFGHAVDVHNGSFGTIAAQALGLPRNIGEYGYEGSPSEGFAEVFGALHSLDRRDESKVPGTWARVVRSLEGKAAGGFMPSNQMFPAGRLRVPTTGLDGGGQPYIIGEKGPELFVPEESGWIIPHHVMNSLPRRVDGGAATPGGEYLANVSADRNKKRYHCPQCGKWFGKMGRLNDHIEKDHKGARLTSKEFTAAHKNVASMLDAAASTPTSGAKAAEKVTDVDPAGGAATGGSGAKPPRTPRATAGGGGKDVVNVRVMNFSELKGEFGTASTGLKFTDDAALKRFGDVMGGSIKDAIKSLGIGGDDESAGSSGGSKKSKKTAAPKKPAEPKLPPITPIEKVSAATAAESEVQTLRQKQQETANQIAEAYQLSPVRALSTSIGQISANVIGGRKGIISRAKTAAAANAQATSDTSDLERQITRYKEAEEQLATLKRAGGDPAEMAKAQANMDLANEAIEGRPERNGQPAVIGLRAKSEASTERAAELQKGIVSGADVVRNVAAGGLGVVAGTMAFSAALSMFQDAMGQIQQAADLAADSLGGFANSAKKWTDSISENVHASKGAIDVALSQTAADIGLSAAATSAIKPLIGMRAAVEAGNKAYAQQIELLRAAQSVGEQNDRLNFNGFDANLTQTTGGFNFLGIQTPLGGTPSTAELLANQLKLSAGMVSQTAPPETLLETAVEPIKSLIDAIIPDQGENLKDYLFKGLPGYTDSQGYSVDPITGEKSKTNDPGPFNTVADNAIGTYAGYDDLRQKMGFGKEEPSSRQQATDAQVLMTKAFVQDTSDAASRVGGAFKFVAASTDDLRATQKQQIDLLRESGIPSLQSWADGLATSETAMQFEGSDSTDIKVFIEGLLKQLKNVALGSNRPDPVQVLKGMTERQIPAMVRDMQRRSTFAIERQQPAEFALQRSAQPFITTVGKEGLQNPSMGASQQLLTGKGFDDAFDANQKQVGEFAKQYKAEVGGAVSIINSQLEKGRKILEQYVDPNTLQQLDSMGKQITSINKDLTQKQTNLAVAEYTNSIRMTLRSLKDARDTWKGITGETGKSYGMLEGMNIKLSRQLQLLGFSLQQRSINFNKAMAGFMAEGLTPEEIDARQEQAKYEADIQQKQLDLSKEIAGNQYQQTLIGAGRNIEDLEAQKKLLEAGRDLTNESAAAMAALELLDAARGVLVDQVNSKLGVGLGIEQSALDVQRDLEATLGREAVHARDIADAFKAAGADASAIAGVLNGTPATSTRSGANNPNESTPQAAGMLGTFSSPTRVTFGEAGTETVAILRNPREHTLGATPSAGGGGMVFNINISGVNASSSEDVDELVRKVTQALNRQASLLGLRAPIGN